MKHIVIISTSWPDAEEGAAAAGSFVVDFAKALVNIGVKVTVVVPALQARNELINGITICAFYVPCLPLSLLSPLNPVHWLKIIQVLLAGHKAVIDACATTPVDHIFALWALPSGYWARLAAARNNIEFSTWALGSDIWSLGKVPGVRTILKSVLASAKIRFADGQQLCRDVERISGKDCTFLPSSRSLDVAIKSTARETPPYRLAFLGRWHINKGIDLLMDTLLNLNDDDWSKIESVRLGGGGPLENEVKASVRKLHLQGRQVELSGYLSREEAKDLLAWTDYLIIPSRIESIPVVFSDAMQVGCPVLASPVGDLKNLIEHYQCGLVAESVTSEAYLKMIRQGINANAYSFQKGIESAANVFTPISAAKKFICDISK